MYKYQQKVAIENIEVTLTKRGKQHKIQNEFYHIKLSEQTMTEKCMLHLPCHANKARTFKTVRLNSDLSYAL
jgi:hypothetical protein